jgi:hypothetical protein
MGVDVDDSDRVYFTDDLASGQEVVFSATGVTDGELLERVRFFGGGARTHSLLMSYKRGLVRFIDTVHLRPCPAATGPPLVRSRPSPLPQPAGSPGVNRDGPAMGVRRSERHAIVTWSG